MRWNSRLAVAVALAIPGLAAPALAQASLRVQPLTVDVPAPGQTSSVTLQNTGQNDISLQVRVFEWTQVDGVDHLEPATDVVASPPVTRIPPGSTYTIRLARTGTPVTAGETSYRLWIDELPPTAPPRAGGGEVTVRLRYDLPMFFHVAGTFPQVTWRAFRSGSDIVLEASNTGTGHARITDLQLIGPHGPLSFGAGLDGYVPAGSARRWTAPAGTLSPADQNISAVAGVNGVEVHQPITIANN